MNAHGVSGGKHGIMNVGCGSARSRRQSVLQRQKRFLWRLEPVETRPLLLVQRLIMFDGVGHRVKSVTKVDFLAPRLVG